MVSSLCWPYCPVQGAHGSLCCRAGWVGDALVFGYEWIGSSRTHQDLKKRSPGVGRFGRRHQVGPSRISKVFCLKQPKWLTNISCKRPESVFSVFKGMHLCCSIHTPTVTQKPQAVCMPMGTAVFQEKFIFKKWGRGYGGADLLLWLVLLSLGAWR